MCEEIEVLNALVCKPPEEVFVVWLSLLLAVYQISSFGILGMSGMFLKLFQYSLPWYIVIVPSGTYRSQVEYGKVEEPIAGILLASFHWTWTLFRPEQP